jgi:beta-galactosidase GanA
MVTTSPGTHAVTVTVTRAKLYKTALRNNLHSWEWTYSWTADDDSHMVQSGDRMVNVGSYGRHLGSLRDMLKRKYGKRLTLVEAWKTEAAR